MCFMNDPKLLPVRSPDHVVERDSMEIFSDHSGQTLIAYAPKGVQPRARAGVCVVCVRY